MLPLRPYNHQIGGHSLMLEVNKKQICKILSRKEKFFYDTVPDNLKEFIPQFYGVMSVQFDRDEITGLIKCSGTLVDDHHDCIQCTVVEDEIERQKLYHLKSKSKKHVNTIIISDVSIKENGSFTNPWIQSQLEVLSTKILTKEVHDFMILENLTGPYIYPCILELKLGTRFYTNDMSPRRITRRIEQSRNTTSFTMGLRFAGMQIYNASKKSYNFHDEKYGNILTPATIYQVIRSFVYDDLTGNYHIDIVRELVRKLYKLKDVINQLNSHRFCSSSLLMIYEGHRSESVKTKQSSVDVRMIDFQKFDTVQCSDTGPDEGCIHGLTSLISILEPLLL